MGEGQCWGLARSGSGGVPGFPRTSRRRKRILSRCGRAPRSAAAASRPSSYSPVLPSPAGANSQPLPRLRSQNPAVWKKGAAGAGGQLGTAPLSLLPQPLPAPPGRRRWGGRGGWGLNQLVGRRWRGTGDRCSGILSRGHWWLGESLEEGSELGRVRNHLWNPIH